MSLNRIKFIDKLTVISFVIMLFTGLIKWLDIWPIDATMIFAMITSIFLLNKIRSKMKIVLGNNALSKIALIVPFSLWLYISVFYSSSNLYVYTKATNYLLIILSFIIPFFLIKNKNDLLFFLNVLASVGLTISFIFLYLYISDGGNLYLSYFKFLENGNPLGVPDYLSLGSAVGITVIIFLFNKSNYIKLLGFFAALTLVVLSGRGPVIAILLIMLIFIYYNFKFKLAHIINLLFLIFLIFLSLKNLNFKSFERLEQRFELMFEEPSHNESLTVRLALFEKSYDYFTQNPFFGIGLGSFGVLRQKKEVRDHPHNMIIEILVEQGILGFILFLFFLLPLIKTVRNLIRNKDYTYFACGSIFIFEFINTIKSSSIIENRLFFAIASVCFIAIQLSNKNNLKLGDGN